MIWLRSCLIEYDCDRDDDDRDSSKNHFRCEACAQIIFDEKWYFEDDFQDEAFAERLIVTNDKLWQKDIVTDSLRAQFVNIIEKFKLIIEL